MITPRIRIRVPALPLFAPRQARRIVQEELTEAMRESVLLADSALVKASPVGVSGRFRAGWQPRVSVVSSRPVRIRGQNINITPYATFANAGRPPGRFPPFGPSSDLARWVRRTLGAQVPVFPIARAIARFGTRRYRLRLPSVIDQAVQQVEQPVRRRFRQARDRIARRLRGDA